MVLTSSGLERQIRLTHDQKIHPRTGPVPLRSLRSLQPHNLRAHPIDIMQQGQVVRAHEAKPPPRTHASTVRDRGPACRDVPPDNVKAQSPAVLRMRGRERTGGILPDAGGAADEDGDERVGGHEGGVGGADEVEVDHGCERTCSLILP